jgi:hypothetical protein
VYRRRFAFLTEHELDVHAEHIARSELIDRRRILAETRDRDLLHVGPGPSQHFTRHARSGNGGGLAIQNIEAGAAGLYQAQREGRQPGRRLAPPGSGFQ